MAALLLKTFFIKSGVCMCCECIWSVTVDGHVRGKKKAVILDELFINLLRINHPVFCTYTIALLADYNIIF